MSGLSPLARGTREPKIFALWDCRFIPAGAGNTDRNRPTNSQRAVYPRWRGEHGDISHTLKAEGGLSPLARGTRANGARPPDNRRFIPAGAGNTLSVTHSSNYQPVYPRWRGEHPMGIRYDNTVYGLSPLARGTRGNGNRPRGRGRFIPAGAGNTMSGTMPRLSGPVYPRWRGEHPMDPTFAVCVTGLSPLARGTLQLDARMNLLTRFIPAGAGNTLLPAVLPLVNPVYPRWRGEHNIT